MLDTALAHAITEITADFGQPRSVAQRLLAWLKQMSEAELTKDENTQFLANVCNALLVEEDADED